MLRAEYRGATGQPEARARRFPRSAAHRSEQPLRAHGPHLPADRRRELDAAAPRDAAGDEARARRDPDFQGVVGSAWLALERARARAAVFRRAGEAQPRRLPVAAQLRRRARPEQPGRHGVARAPARVDQDPRGDREATAGQGRRCRAPAGAGAHRARSSCPATKASAVIRNLLRADADAEHDAVAIDPRQQRHRRRHARARARLDDQHRAVHRAPRRGCGSSTRATSPRRRGPRSASRSRRHNDVETLQRALERKSADAIPRYDRHEAARSTQQYRYAQDIAFTELEKQPVRRRDAPAAHAVGVRHGEPHAGGLHATSGAARSPGTNGRPKSAVWLSPRLRLSVDVSYIDQRPAQHGGARDRSRRATALYGITALWRHAIGETRFRHLPPRSARRRHRLPARRTRYPLGPRVGSRIGLAYNERALETSALGGGRRARPGLRRSPVPARSKREYVLGQLYGSRYYTQDRAHLHRQRLRAATGKRAIASAPSIRTGT